MMAIRALASAVALLATSLVPAHSAVMTFDDVLPARGSGGLPTPPNQPAPHIWIEDGITAHARDSNDSDDDPTTWIHSHAVPGAVHMIGSSYSWPDNITFTMEYLFDAVSFDILPGTNYFWRHWTFPEECGESTDCSIPFDNVEVTGLRDGSMIAQDSFYMRTEPWTYFFSSAFSDLDTLVIALLMPGPDLWSIGECDSNPCVIMDIKNVTLSPVSLPAPLLLFLTGLGALALLGRRKAGATTSLH